MPPLAKRVVRNLSLLCLIGTAAASILGLLGGLFWLFDLFAHFRVQYLFLLMLAAAALGLLKMWRWAGAAAVLALVHVAIIAPLFLGSPGPSASNDDALSLVVFNVNYGNHNYDKLTEYLERSDEDVIVVLEATAPMEHAISKALPAHHQIAEPREDAFGMLVYSKLPFKSQELRYLGDSALPSLDFAVEKAGQRYHILGLHTMPPVGAANSALRDRMLHEAAEWAEDKGDALVLGDFNATPWSHAFASLLEEGHLTNSQEGFGIQGSWPAGLWPMSIPIDHAVHGPALTTVERSVGPFLGSDHRPLHLRVGGALD